MLRVKVLLAEDHTIVRKGLCSLLNAEPGINVVGEAEDGKEAVDMVGQLHPDIVLMDITMPGLNGVEATRQIKRRFPEVKVVVLTMHATDEYIFHILRAGASAYVVKDAAPKELVSAIKAVCRGGSYLSPEVSTMVLERYVRQAAPAVSDDSYERLTNREREVLQLIAEGHSNREIGRMLFVSVKTVETHRAHTMEKLDIHSTAGLTRYAVRKGLVSAE